MIDVRAAERFRGDAPEPRPGLRAGHMPGATNLPHSTLLTLEGHPLAGAVHFATAAAGAAIRFQVEVFDRAATVLDKTDERSTIQRRLGRARAESAVVLATTHGPPGEIRDSATQALAWYRRAGGPPGQLAELERLTGSP